MSDANIIARNRQANFNYEFIEKYEVGIELLGGEVKAIRKGKINIKDAYIRIENNEAFLLQSHIALMDTINKYFSYKEYRKRKLLLHKREIRYLFGKLSSNNSLTIIPLKVYINKRNFIKVTIALAKGKKSYDKRESIKKRDMEILTQRIMKNYG